MQEMWQELWVRSLGLEDPLEKEMATHSSILVWEILRTEEPGELESMELQRVGPDLATKHTHTHTSFQTHRMLLESRCKEGEATEPHGWERRASLAGSKKRVIWDFFFLEKKDPGIWLWLETEKENSFIVLSYKTIVFLASIYPVWLPVLKNQT